MHKITNINPKRILVCQLRQIGDVLLSTPAIQLLNERYPDASIDVLTEKKCTPVLENNPRINQIWPIDKAALKNPFKALAYYAKIGRQNYDLVIDFQQLPRCKWVVRLSKAAVKLTFTPPWYNRLTYSHWTEMLNGYAAKAKASVLAPLGINWDGEKPEIWLTDQEKLFAADFIATHGIADKPFITVDPTHRRKTRQWPARHFIGIIRLLREHHPDLQAVILYGPGEEAEAQAIANGVGDGAIMPQSMLSLREMAAVQNLASMHLGNCSSPRHFAVAVGTPSFIVHGATAKAWRFPSEEHFSALRRDPCIAPCNKNTCKFGTIDCLEKFMPEDLIEDALTTLQMGIEKRKTPPQA